jgi:hypothetical protein
LIFKKASLTLSANLIKTIQTLKTICMKSTILLLISFFTFSSGLFASQTEIDLTKLPEPKGPRPLSLTYFPVSATISETELSIYFDSVVGLATIKVYDANDNIVSIEIVDSITTSELYIATNAWLSGEYKIEISYETTILSGIFLVE